MGCNKSVPELIFRPKSADPTPNDPQKKFESLYHQFISKEVGSINDHFKILKAVGTTSTGTFLFAEDIQTGTLRAIHEISKSQLKDTPSILSEIAILSDLDHPNIVKIFQTIETSINYYVVYEVLEGGDLSSRITRTGNEMQVSKYMHEVLSALYYLHIRGIVHCDINPANVLFTTNEDDAVPKIVAFSSAQNLSEGPKVSVSKLSYVYVSPDILKKDFNEKTDLWSVGVMIYELLVGKNPFSSKDRKGILKQIYKGELDLTNPNFLNLTFNAQDLVKKLLNTDPVQRLSAKDALSHPWLSQSTKEYYYNYEIKSNIGREMLNFINFKSNFKETDVVQLFKNVDSDFDGCLSREEILQAFKQIGVDAENEVDKIIANLDINRSGNLDFTELKIALIDWKKELKKKLFARLFKAEGEWVALINLKHQLPAILPHEWNEFAKKTKAENGRVKLEALKGYMKGVIDY